MTNLFSRPNVNCELHSTVRSHSKLPVTPRFSSIHVVLRYVLAAGLGSNATVRGHTWRGDFVIVPFKCFLSTVNYALTKPPGGHINWRFLFSDGVRMV